ncbi:MAG: MaoC family dehydratase N-terminal domain-containing protein [Chloroflexota bacterium]
MVMGDARITDDGLTELRKRLGIKLRRRPYNQEATRDTIRHFCYGIGDGNPLWLDATYAGKTRWGRILAPPSFLNSVDWAGARWGGLAGVHGFHSGSDWQWFHPIRVGDSFTVWARLTDVIEKQSEFAGKTILLVGETTYYNQRQEKVANVKAITFRAERRAGREKGKYASIKAHVYSPEEIKAIEEAYEKEETRGANPRYWEDVKEGGELTPVIKGPLTLTDQMAFGAGCLGGLAHGLALKEFKKHPAWGWRDESGALQPMARVHENPERAREIGIPGHYDYGCQRISWLIHLMTNWQSDDGFLKKLDAQLRRFNLIGDTTWCKGKVTRKYVENEEHLVECDIWAENQRGETTAPGHATVMLPSRAP